MGRASASQQGPPGVSGTCPRLPRKGLSANPLTAPRSPLSPLHGQPSQRVSALLPAFSHLRCAWCHFRQPVSTQTTTDSWALSPRQVSLTPAPHVEWDTHTHPWVHLQKLLLSVMTHSHSCASVICHGSGFLGAQSQAFWPHTLGDPVLPQANLQPGFLLSPGVLSKHQPPIKCHSGTSQFILS